MAIQSIKDAKELRKYGEKLGREGIAKLAIEICTKVATEQNYIEAIKAVGMIQALAQACKFDDYWDEKRWIGFGQMLDKAEFENKKTT